MSPERICALTISTLALGLLLAEPALAAGGGGLPDLGETGEQRRLSHQTPRKQNVRQPPAARLVQAQRLNHVVR